MFGLAAVLLAASVGAGRTSTPAPAPSQTRTVSIAIHFSRFDPASIDAAPGETVRFLIRNTDPIDHEFILGDEVVQAIHERGTEAVHPPKPGEVSVPAGATVETTYMFRARGALTYGCHLPGHFAYGMLGTVSVG